MGALGPKGARQVVEIFRDEINRALAQIGCDRYMDLNRAWLSCGAGEALDNGVFE